MKKKELVTPKISEENETVKMVLSNRITLILLFSLMLICINYTHAIDNSIVAEVGKYKITTEEYWKTYDNVMRFYRDIYKDKFDEEMEKKMKLKEKVLDSLINDKVLLIAAEDAGISVSDKEIQNAITREPAFMKEGRFNEQIFLNRLKLNRITVEEYKRLKRQELTISKMKNYITKNTANAQFKEEEIRKFIDKYKTKVRIIINPNQTYTIETSSAFDKSQIARNQIELLGQALDQFRLYVGRYPTTGEGLQALMRNPGIRKWEGPYLKKEIPMDPWGRPYIYVSPGKHGDYDLFSLGKDGIPGGTGENEDITSWGGSTGYYDGEQKRRKPLSPM
ncbi:MAG: type II secretion system protein GspG [Nitrospira sp.]|nr:type II secretion system protein GspG [Nitrospira sp.]